MINDWMEREQAETGMVLWNSFPRTPLRERRFDGLHPISYGAISEERLVMGMETLSTSTLPLHLIRAIHYHGEAGWV